MRMALRGRAFAISGTLHAGVLAWVALGSAVSLPAPAVSLYDSEIRPNEKRLVWYDFRQRLPEVAPAAAGRPALPARAVKLEQTIVAGAREDRQRPQLIWTPAPEVEPGRPVPLPNVLQLAAGAQPVRRFVEPPAPRLPDVRVLLPDAPRTSAPDAGRLPFALTLPKPQPRAFVPPVETRRHLAAVTAPEAPSIPADVRPTAAPFTITLSKPQPRTFVPPTNTRRNSAAPVIAPEAPRVAADLRSTAAPFTVALPKPQPRAFIPPPDAHRHPATPLAPETPDLAAGAAPAQASLAIVGLDPANTLDFPAPPGSRQAGFSGGPEPRPSGGDAGAPKAMIVVPGLLARGGDADSRPTLVAAIPPSTRERLAASAHIVPRPADAPSETHAPRAGSAPDPLLEGRAVYVLAIQMPNVTSYMGSWIVWFAERGPAASGSAPEIRPPLPLHMVHPKYIAAAAYERIEGKVRLAAVIRKDGRVDGVTLLHHLDDRLDRSAEEALAQWEFEPAFRAGRAVEVDAVFEIPFTLAPRSSQ